MSTNDQDANIDMILDFIYITVDVLSKHRQFDILDDWLKNLNNLQLSKDIIIGILVSTLSVKSKLNHRNKFYSVAEQRLGSELLKGLK